MHDTPQSDVHSDTPVTDLIDELAAADPASAPDIADAIAARLESGLTVPEAASPA